MNKEDRVKVLKDSIEHWRRMRAFTADDFYVEDCESPYWNDCTCCNAFDSDDCTDSSGDLCPIAVKAGALCCSNTPWSKAHASFYDTMHAFRTGAQCGIENWRAAADEMIAFMAECLKEEEAK